MACDECEDFSASDMNTNNINMFSKFSGGHFSRRSVLSNPSVRCNPLSVLVSPFFVAALVLFGLSNNVEAQLYRYKNAKGIVVIEDKIPPEVVANGYDILRYDGTLVRRVKRQLTGEELEKRNTQEARARLREEEEKRLQEWDASLMRRYSSTDDIDAARERAMRDLDIRVSILKSNLHTIKAQIEREQKKAADIERRGGDVPQDLLKNIDILRLEISDTEQSIVVRLEEVASVRAAFERDLERFQTLVERVNMRRKQSPSTSQSSSKASRY
jgi:hypothetical protein